MPTVSSPVSLSGVIWLLCSVVALTGCAVPLTRLQGPPAVASEATAEAEESAYAGPRDAESVRERPRTPAGAAIASPQPGPPHLGITGR